MSVAILDSMARVRARNETEPRKTLGMTRIKPESSKQEIQEITCPLYVAALLRRP